ncbi:MAG TPA: GNAT family N-acetyltransferase [Thermotogota bacterium]|nr:GNAT family N-acetyltransferase [Thermotogota bacterium]
MAIIARRYDREKDYERVGQFLVDTYHPGKFPNWLQPRWEYMHYHPITQAQHFPRIGLWEDAGKIVGMANYEHSPGWAYFALHPGYPRLKPQLLEYAMENLRGEDKGRQVLRLFINDFDGEMNKLVEEAGFELDEGYRDTVSILPIPNPFPEISLPEGFKLQSLAEENDLYKADRALYRGFDHPGEPPEDGVEGRAFMQSAPNFQLDLNLVVKAPSGDFVSYAGIWVEPVHKVAYVEPVATDPDFRRMGLGKAAVMESIRRAGQKGATVAYVGSEQPFYRNMGFQTLYHMPQWVKWFD